MSTTAFLYHKRGFRIRSGIRRRVGSGGSSLLVRRIGLFSPNPPDKLRATSRQVLMNHRVVLRVTRHASKFNVQRSFTSPGVSAYNELEGMRSLIFNLWRLRMDEAAASTLLPRDALINPPQETTNSGSLRIHTVLSLRPRVVYWSRQISSAGWSCPWGFHVSYNCQRGSRTGAI